jgi:hypothetical protein
MPTTSLRIADLDPLFASVSYEEATAIANLGAVCWTHFKDRLFAHWTATANAEEADRADQYREEGRKTATAEVLESLKGRLAAADAMEGELSVARAAVDKLQGVVAAEAAKRAEALVESARMEFELQKAKEFASLREQVAAAVARDKYVSMVEDSHSDLKTNIILLTKELEGYKKATSTKSSHTLGKIGEATVWEMLQSYVLPKFEFSEAKNMTAVKHVGDFHVWVNGPNGKRIKLMLDAKKYSTPVQNTEVDKLFSDLDGDDADAGLMISLDTPIYTKLQFQITKSKAGKPCMFMSFEKLDDGIRQEVLCWAVRVLVCIVASRDGGSKDMMITEIGRFLEDLTVSLTDLDACVKTSKGLYDNLREIRERVVSRISSYRSVCGMEDMEPVLVMPTVDMRCQGKKINGERCKSRRMPTGIYCARHNAEAGAGTGTVVGSE